ncbi:follistatin-related protein 1-like isoform X2 [Corythoichthys intestinalis]|uniref:follistatin-related protein 1-like isoform X2 n=1 Tax=Corythoichthys intestinalis TaxID=161448 RepID=UPI0025A50AF0|nr:follistatin-related protein 1-like isoform X2 [Corythoichthys intestinalis]
MLTISVLLFLHSHAVSTSPVAKEDSVCAETFCGAGRECVSTERGEPVCRCLEQCIGSEHWVCGSNNKSYRNHCELHRDACVTHTKIHVEYVGPCHEKAEKLDMNPMVCFQSDRDWLRDRVIRWVRAEVTSDNQTFYASTVTDLMQSYFQMYDSGDSQLDSKEFLSFLNQNETALNLTYSENPDINLLLRSLCVDALIELSDEDADWKLSLAEFINCLTPSFHPPERKCELEDEVLEEGAETRMKCNKCVCACGNWVCTALTCNEPHVDEKDDGVEEEMTEKEWIRTVAQLNTLQENFPTES